MKKVLGIIAIILSLFQSCAFAETIDRENADSTMFHGDYIKENEIRESRETTNEHPMAFVLCETLNIYSQNDIQSEVIGTLDYSKSVEVLEESENLYYILFYDLSNNNISEKNGWISKEYVILDPPYYIANHPSPVLALPQTNAKKLCYLSTYDSLRVIGEINEYYIVSINCATGFVIKE